MESAAEDDSVEFDHQILHQSAATGEDARSARPSVTNEGEGNGMTAG